MNGFKINFNKSKNIYLNGSLSVNLHFSHSH